MPMKIDVGVCKKIGLPDYGSAGSHCNITLEADICVLNDPNEFQRRVQHAYELCRLSVEKELHGLKTGEQHVRTENIGTTSQVTLAPKTEYRNSNATSSNNRYPATQKQQQFIRRLVKGIKGLNDTRLDEYCQQEFGKTSQELTAQDASKLIDMLKESQGKGGVT